MEEILLDPDFTFQSKTDNMLWDIDWYNVVWEPYENYSLKIVYIHAYLLLYLSVWLKRMRPTVGSLPIILCL